MKFFGIHLEDLESERFLAATNDQIATWLFLHALCSKQMNGGTIPEASTLPERFWSRHGISADIITRPSPLWSWSGDDLTVEPYDIDGETLFIKKVKGGKDGAAKRWKGSENRSPIESPNRPNLTLPNLTKPDQTGENDSLFPENPPSKKRRDRGTLEELKSYAIEIGLPESDGVSMFNRWDENGWMNGKNKVRSWRKTMDRWKHEGWHPSQKAPQHPASHDALQEYAKGKDIAADIATAWWDSRKAVGWKVNCQPIVDWESDLFGFVDRWNRNADKPNNSTASKPPKPKVFLDD